jgi:hypothetical protein
MGDNGGLPQKPGDPVHFRLLQELTHGGPGIIPGINFEELKYQIPPEGPVGMAYTLLDPTAPYRPVQEQQASIARPPTSPTHEKLFPDGSLPDYEGMTIFRRSILDTSKYNIEFWQRSWAHRGNSLVLIQLRKSKVGSQFSYGHMWFKSSDMRGRFCDEWVRKSLKSMVDKTSPKATVGITGGELAIYVAKFQAVPQNQGKT